MCAEDFCLSLFGLGYVVHCGCNRDIVVKHFYASTMTEIYDGCVTFHYIKRINTTNLDPRGDIIDK